MHTELINRQFGLIRTLNPVHYDENAVAVSYEPWELYRGPNRELSRARIVVGCFSGSAVSSPSTSQRLGVPQQERPSEPISEEPREELTCFVIPSVPDADSASSEVSDSEDDHPQHNPVKTGIVYSRSVKGGWVNLDTISKTASTVNASETHHWCHQAAHNSMT